MDRTYAILLVVLLVLTTAMLGNADDARVLSAEFADQEAWSVFADEPWWALVDIRDMLNIFHPLSVPQTGNAAGASRELTIPADWKPPFALRFFCADDYFADPENHKPGQLGTESFFDHRFKQVLIDDIVVWEHDVIDENIHGSQTIFQVDITPYVTPGETFNLTFRVLDKTSTTERNDRDVWFIAGTWYTGGDDKTEQEPRFHTAIWFADPVIGEQAAVEAAPPGTRPHEAAVKERHRERLSMPPPGLQMSSPAKFELVTPARIPEPGFPITCGIPLPPGALTDAKAVRLRDRRARDLPVQTKVTGWWPDGSIRWLLLNAIAPAGTREGEKFRLHFNEGTGPGPEIPLSIQQRGDRLTINTGAVRLELGSDQGKLLDAVYLAGKDDPVLTDLVPRMEILLDEQPRPVAATCQHTEVIERGPIAACVEMRGSLDTDEQHIGRFTFRLYAYAGLPTVQIQFRIYNDVKPEPYAGTVDDPPLDVTNLALVATISGVTKRRKAIGIVNSEAFSTDGAEVRLLQDTHEHFGVSTAAITPIIEGEKAQGWIAAGGTGGAVQASMWRFWQQYPKSLAVDGNTLEIGLFAPSEATPAYRPRFGEAKRHDIWLTFSAEPLSTDDQEALGLLADEPPRLFDGEWFCLSGGISVLDPEWFEHQPKLAKYVADSYGDISTARVTRHFGLRDFGDMPYTAPQWLNGYWAMVQGALNCGLASADQRWIERSFEIARHIADVDAVHIPPGHPDWNEWHGLTCALGSDHSVHNGGAKWAAFQIGESLLLHYWMTGDPDSLDAGIANADYLIRNNVGLGSASARCQARPMLTLLRAWQATGDAKYRDAAQKYLNLRYQIEHVIDWRRGAYIQPTYQNWRCVSAGLNSMYAQNIYDYYRLTGDLEAAQMVVAVADSVYAESMLPQEEGIGSFLFYVRYSRGAWYYTEMAILFHMAYDLTGDVRFLRAGRAAFERYLLGTYYQPFHNFGWLDPEFGGWQQRFKDTPTEPFEITSEIPDPDPANYR